ncbi:MAG: ABC transporter permease subunit [Clostridiaceae bacterium]|nr:ABC transporter permease subunit [Clostridiaceae bacterium]
MALQNKTAVTLREQHPKHGLWKRILRHYDLYLFILPALVWYIIFTYGPLYGVQIAFKNFNGALGIWGSPWVGLKHFRNFLTAYTFPNLLKNTITLSIYSLAAGFPFPIILALMLNELNFKRYKKIVQTVTYAPHFISMVVMVGMLTLFFSPSMGVINTIRGVFGMESVNFLTRPDLFRHLYVWSGVWQGMGWGSIIYLAALSAVDPQQHEAAVIDGASRLQRIWYINIPVLLPTVTILLILNCGSILSVGYEKVLLMQNDLVLDVAEVISTYVYKRGLLKAEYSYSAAVGLFNNVVNVMILLCVNGIVRKLGQTSLF